MREIAASGDVGPDERNRISDAILETFSNEFGGSAPYGSPAPDMRATRREALSPIPVLEGIDVTKLLILVRETERWRDYMLNLGYELNQLTEMKVKCSDATIKVRRLVHNFEERM